MNIEQKKEIARAKMKAVLEPSVYESWLEQVDDGFNHIPWYEYGSSYDILHNSFPFAADDKIDWWGVRSKLKSGEVMNTDKQQDLKDFIQQIESDMDLCGTRMEKLKKALAEYKSELERELEESKKPKTKYAIGQTYYVIYENGVYLAHVFHNSVFDNSIIAMGNDAASTEEAERKIRRRKGVVKYNEIVERENAKYAEERPSYYINSSEKERFAYLVRTLSNDVKPVCSSALSAVRPQLTPELINDLFCI